MLDALREKGARQIIFDIISEMSNCSAIKGYRCVEPQIVVTLWIIDLNAIEDRPSLPSGVLMGSSKRQIIGSTYYTMQSTFLKFD